MTTVLIVIHTLIVLFLIVMILIQRTDSDGMGGLSGGGGNQFLTGRSSANLLTRTTAILATVFMLTSLALATLAGRADRSSIVDMEVAPVVDTKPAAPAKKEAAPVKKKTETPAVPKPE